MDSINHFVKGLNTDIDVSRLEPLYLSDAENIRIYNDRERGLILSNVKGNEKFFKITEGFIPIGVREYCGILVIISHNPFTGYDEVGTYPSPHIEITDSGEPYLDYVYKPLTNLTYQIQTVPVSNPNIDYKDENGLNHSIGYETLYGFFSAPRLLNLSLDYPILDMEFKLDPDGTINIYFTDYNNPMRKINLGFDSSGRILNSIEYNYNDIFGETVMIKSSTRVSNVFFNGLDIGGNMLFGFYNVYFRYLDDNQNPTNIIGETRMFPCYRSSKGIVVTGEPTWDGTQQEAAYATYMGKATESSQNKIKLLFTDLDPAYKYVDIIYQRVHSDEANVDQIEEYMIKKDPLLVEDLIENGEVIIDNPDDFGEFTLAKSVIPVLTTKENTCKSIKQLHGRLWGANWKGGISRNIALNLEKLSLDIRIQPTFERHWQYWYAASKLCNTHTGYFWGEYYTFRIHYILNDGTETDGFKIGKYGASQYMIADGVFRFPEETYDINRLIKLPDIPLQSANCIQMYPQFIFTTQIISELKSIGVIGIYITRAERDKNFLMEGLVSRVAKYKTNLAIPFYYVGASRKILNSSGVTTKYANEVNDDTEVVFGHSQNSLSFYSNDINFERVSSINKIGNSIVNIKFTRFDSKDVIKPPVNQSGNSRCYVLNISDNILLQDTSIVDDYFAIKRNSGEKLIINGISNLCSQVVGPYNLHYIKDGADVASNKNIKFNNSIILLSNSADSVIPDNSNIRERVYPEELTPVEETLLEFTKFAAIYASTSPKKYETELILFKISQNIKLSDIELNPIFSLGGGDCYIGENINTVYSWFDSYNFFGNNKNRYERPQDDEYTRYKGFYPEILRYTGIMQHQYNPATRYINFQNDYYNEIYLKYVYYKNKLDIYGTLPWGNFVYGIYQMDPGEVVYGDVMTFDYNKPDISNNIKYYINYDEFYNKRSLLYPTRIRWSDVDNPNPDSFSDGFLNFPETSFKDFDYTFGEITGLEVLNGSLISVSEKGAHEHIIRQSDDKIQVDEQSQSLILGSDSILSPMAKKISDFGTQCKLSIVNTGDGIYYTDAINKVIVCIGPQRASNGSVFVQGDDISRSKGINNLVSSFTDEEYSKDIQILTNTFIAQTVSFAEATKGEKGAFNIDRPYGIIGGYDPKYREVYQTIYANNKNENKRITIVYSEMLGVFTSKYNMYGNLYASYENNLISYKYSKDTISSIYKANSNNYNSVFFDENYPTILSFYVNGAISAEENYSTLSKLFEAIEISCSEHEIFSILFETSDQKAIIEPSTEERFWMKPIYQEGKWKISIPRMDSQETDYYKNNSQLTGEWLKITIQFNTNMPIFVKNIKTTFNISYNYL